MPPFAGLLAARPGVRRPLALAIPLVALACSSPTVFAPPPPAQAPERGGRVEAPAAPEGPAPAYARALIEGVPHVRQKPDFCGEACVEMATRRLGKPIGQDAVFNLSDVDPALGRGVVTPELRAVLERIGFRTGPVWQRVDAARAGAEMEAQFAALHADLAAGVPSIVCMRYDDGPQASEHFRLLVGYDPATDEVVYHEPAEDRGGYKRMSRARFLRLWPLKYDAARWTVIRLRLDPDAAAMAAAPAPPPAAPGRSRADYAQHVLELRRRAGPGFTVAVEPPFVVIGDGAAAAVQGSAERTVRWATRMLKQDYFSKDPARILDVWLFKDATSYTRNTLRLFDETPETPYGYYTSKHGALIMNIATGGGTLVHEIVHPFMENNFPGCPPWFNEGLASLYEQSGEERGHIHGYTNWRLAGLKRAIRARQVPPFRELLSASEVTFYEEDKGTNYSQARYLCYYLQQAGLLVRFYQEFLAGREQDPTGYDTLQRVLGEDDMVAFQQRWEAFVMGLSYP